MNIHTFQKRPSWKTIGIVAASMSFAFLIGIQTASDVKPIIGGANADSSLVEGDLDGNGVIAIADALLALEIAQGYTVATPEELAADPNRDYVITFDDVSTILLMIEHASHDPEL